MAGEILLLKTVQEEECKFTKHDWENSVAWTGLKFTLVLMSLPNDSCYELPSSPIFITPLSAPTKELGKVEGKKRKRRLKAGKQVQSPGWAEGLWVPAGPVGQGFHSGLSYWEPQHHDPGAATVIGFLNVLSHSESLEICCWFSERKLIFRMIFRMEIKGLQ